MDISRRQVLSFILCLLLRNIGSQFVMADNVDGTVNLSVTLPCSFTFPSNWKDNELRVIWFKNFTEKLWDCLVKDGKDNECQWSPKSSRTQILGKVFGDVHLHISALRESDAGPYQCWIILSDSYRRRDLLLRVHGVHSDIGSVKDTSGQWVELVVTQSPWSVFLLGGWAVAIFLAGILWTQRCISRRTRKYRLINVI